MTIILALDTSSDACSVALLRDGARSSLCVDAPREHTKRLLPMVDEILSTNNLKLHDLDAIAYGRGPGSFTGLRICLGVVQGLAYAADLPVIAVSTLQAMVLGARRELDLNAQKDVVVAMDARMSEVYWGHYTGIGAQAVVDERVSSPMDLAQYMNDLASRDDVVVVGPGWHYSDLNEFNVSAAFQGVMPKAQDVLSLAESSWLAGEYTTAEKSQPTYLRDSVAWQKRKRIRQS